MFTLRAGDMLVIPPGWWHYVASDPGTIMLNFWFDVR
jgi:ribosomal protein L16 Arg81 hydroxylase